MGVANLQEECFVKVNIFLWILTKRHLFQSITSRMDPVRQDGRRIGPYVPAVSLTELHTERQEVINQLKNFKKW